MARYGQAFKDKAVARLLPPESASVETVSHALSISTATLERWRADALSKPARERAWTAPARFEAVLVTAAMDEASKSAWCRENGVYPQHPLQPNRRSTTAVTLRIERLNLSFQRRPWRDRFNLGEESITPRFLLLGSVLQVGKARLHRSQSGCGATAPIVSKARHQPGSGR